MIEIHRHPYHLVDPSPWPLTRSLGAFLLTRGLISWFHCYSVALLLVGAIRIILSMAQWWRDVIREGTFQGAHTRKVQRGLQWGIVLFIISEVLFFFSFFWAFFHSRLTPRVELGGVWPPIGIQPFDPFDIPLLNTAILLASGATVTWAHHSLTQVEHREVRMGLLLTVLLGLYFTRLQYFEYLEAPFSIADSAYGSTFFIATGFHGLHVVIGTTFLLICLFRLLNSHFSPKHHFGFEAAAWY